MPTFRVDPALLRGLAGRFGELAVDLESLTATGLELGDAGDPNLVSAIEQFVEKSRGGVGELLRQCDLVRQVLTATSLGYDNTETHVATGIVQNLESAPGPVSGPVQGR